METLLPHPSPFKGDQNTWNQNYTYIFEVNINKPNINDDEINTLNARVGFSEKTTNTLALCTGNYDLYVLVIKSNKEPKAKAFVSLKLRFSC